MKNAQSDQNNRNSFNGVLKCSWKSFDLSQKFVFDAMRVLEKNYQILEMRKFQKIF